jgi:hypothetical protein
MLSGHHPPGDGGLLIPDISPPGAAEENLLGFGSASTQPFRNPFDEEEAMPADQQDVAEMSQAGPAFLDLDDLFGAPPSQSRPAPDRVADKSDLVDLIGDSAPPVKTHDQTTMLFDDFFSGPPPQTSSKAATENTGLALQNLFDFVQDHPTSLSSSAAPNPFTDGDPFASPELLARVPDGSARLEMGLIEEMEEGRSEKHENEHREQGGPDHADDEMKDPEEQKENAEDDLWGAAAVRIQSLVRGNRDRLRVRAHADTREAHVGAQRQEEMEGQVEEHGQALSEATSSNEAESGLFEHETKMSEQASRSSSAQSSPRFGKRGHAASESKTEQWSSDERPCTSPEEEHCSASSSDDEMKDPEEQKENTEDDLWGAAAVRIQSLVRGNRDRLRVSVVKEIQEADSSSACTEDEIIARIQAREYSETEENEEEEEEGCSGTERKEPGVRSLEQDLWLSKPLVDRTEQDLSSATKRVAEAVHAVVNDSHAFANESHALDIQIDGALLQAGPDHGVGRTTTGLQVKEVVDWKSKAQAKSQELVAEGAMIRGMNLEQEEVQERACRGASDAIELRQDGPVGVWGETGLGPFEDQIAGLAVQLDALEVVLERAKEVGRVREAERQDVREREEIQTREREREMLRMEREREREREEDTARLKAAEEERRREQATMFEMDKLLEAQAKIAQLERNVSESNCQLAEYKNEADEAAAASSERIAMLEEKNYRLAHVADELQQACAREEKLRERMAVLEDQSKHEAADRDRQMYDIASRCRVLEEHLLEAKSALAVANAENVRMAEQGLQAEEALGVAGKRVQDLQEQVESLQQEVQGSGARVRELELSHERSMREHYAELAKLRGEADEAIEAAQRARQRREQYKGGGVRSEVDVEALRAQLLESQNENLLLRSQVRTCSLDSAVNTDMQCPLYLTTLHTCAILR